MPQIEGISFIFGIIAAILLWWLLRKSSTVWPDVKSFVKQRAVSLKKRNISAVEDHLRRETIRRSQVQHAAWTLFSLDEIGFPPQVLAPPVHVEPGGPLPVDELLSSCLAYMPDWPELPARFGAPVLSLPQALSKGCNIALIGQPGSGKSFALAWLAAQAARRTLTVETVAGLFPIYLHIAGLQIENYAGADPLLPVIASMNEMAPVYTRPQVPDFIRSLFTSGKVLFLLDGVDELPPNQIKEISGYLKAIQRDYPRTRLVITAPSDYLDGFTGLGLNPLAIAGWSNDQYVNFLERWDNLWKQHVVPAIPGKNPSDSIDPVLLSSWLQTDCLGWTPLEYTLKVWAAYAGDLKGSKPADAVEAYLLRLVPETRLWPALEQLALQIVTTSQPVINRHKADQWFSNFSFQGESATNKPAPPSQTTRKPTDNNPIQPDNQIRRLLGDSFENGLLVEHPGDRISFFHPLISGFLAARALANSDNVASLTLQQNWSGKTQTLRFFSCQDPGGSIYQTLTKESDEPLFQGLFQAARWLKDISPGYSWRDDLIKSLIDLLQRDNVPLGIREKAVATLIQSNDTNIASFFRQNLTHSSHTMRQLCILGCGALQDAKALKDLIALQNDSSRLVRYTACLALAFMADRGGRSALEKSLYELDEDLRRAAAESMARTPVPGHEILKTASASEDILVRRAAVFGLAQIQEPWALSILEKMRLEDGQWVVRNAANQAVETIEHGNPHIPRILPLASDAGWLVTFASQQGVGMAGGSMAIDMLIKALKTGNEDERLASLEYLSLSTEEEAVRAVMHAIYLDSGIVSEAALIALWKMSLSGAVIAPANIYGIVS